MNQFHGQPTTVPSPSHAARGFAQTMGLHPAIAFFTLCTDGLGTVVGWP